MRHLLCALLLLVGILGGGWCLFAAVMTAALAGGPTTPEQFAAMKLSTNLLLAKAGGFGLLTIVASIPLVGRVLRIEA